MRTVPAHARARALTGGGASWQRWPLRLLLRYHYGTILLDMERYAEADRMFVR